MKHCPKCNFTFPDFHCVCDFDGTELVQDPEPRSLVKVKTPPPPSRVWRSLKSPVFWAALLLSGVLYSAFLFAYYAAISQSPRVVNARPSPALPASAMPAARASDQSAQVKTPVPSTRGTTINSNRLARSSSANLRRRATAPRQLARLDQQMSDSSKVSTTRVSGWVKPQKSEPARLQKSEPARLQESEPARLQKSEIARRRDTQQISNEKEPKLTAMLKATWRVLKRPFKF